MKNNIQYTKTLKYPVQAILLLRASAALLLLLLIAGPCLAKDEPDPDYDEIPIYISVPGVGSTEIPALIYNEQAYLAVANVFDFLKIRNTLSADFDSVSGFFITPQTQFVIDKKNHRIICGDKVIGLKNSDIIQTDENLYLRSDYFGKAFGLTCVFNFRSLTVVLTSLVELPVVREMRQEAMRNNLMRLTGEVKADTTLLSSHPMFSFGTADWSAITTQTIKGRGNTRFNLALGGTLAGGETTISLNYDSYAKFSERQQYYLWRLVNNDRKALRQVMAGKIYTQSVSSIFSPVVGVQLTNTPTTYRRSFGTYVLSDRTQPNWMVELYVNNVMVNYARADASGFFTFEVPLVYGNSAVKLRFYGPYGEERTTEQNINIPFNFLPERQFEYTVSAGMVEDSVHSRFSRANFNYGLGKRITVGAGVEYLSSVTTGRYMPFVNASVRLASNLLVSGEYVYGVRMKQVLNYRLPSNLQVELAYSRYKKGQRAINNTFLEERRAVVSYPFRGQKLSVFSRLTVYQILLPRTKTNLASKYTNAEVLFSGVLFGVNTNLTTYAMFTGQADPYVYTNLSSTLRLPGKLLVTPQVQYEFNQQKFIAVKGEVGKYLSSQGYANVFYEKNFKSQFEGIGIGFRYDFSFAQVGFSARRSNQVTTLVESAQGSLLYNRETNFMRVNNRTSVGKGGIAIVPFLDLNGNGKRDKNEPRAAGLKVQIHNGRLKNNTVDTIILITDLEAYANYTIKLSTAGFDNFYWQIKNKVLNVVVSPNQLRLVEVPVTVEGEASGSVFVQEGKDRKGLGRIKVLFYDQNDRLVGQSLTEADGTFSYSGLIPGTYTARIDATQMNHLHMKASPLQLSFTILVSNEGGIVDDLEFFLSPGEQR